MKKIETELREWFAYMQNKYTWLTIKYEFDEWRECFLVSLSPTSEISKDWDFCDEEMDFVHKLHKKYGDYAPLFCDEERLFKLSYKAKLLLSQDVLELRKASSEEYSDIPYSNSLDSPSVTQYFDEEEKTEEFNNDNTSKVAA